MVGTLAILAAACSSGEAQPPATGASPEAPVAIEAQPRPDLRPLIEGPVSPDGLMAILATADLAVGEQRVGFVLTTPTGLIRAPAVTVTSLFFPQGGAEAEERQRALALFHPWPLATRGLYTTTLSFDEPGRWGLDISVVNPAGPAQRAQIFYDVAETPSAPAVGSAGIRSHSKTIDDVESLTQLTTGSLPDPDLYQTTLAEAIDSGLPTVVVMASPAFCTNAVCGPQVEVLQELKNEYQGRANFIHIDFYDNPEEIQGDLNLARLSPTVIEWGLPSNEWSFVLDREGIITARFEAFATLGELRQAIERVF